ncbi:OsmC family protein [Plasticicumulans acidivorans]|uniref:Putative OsmC-like protein n=1 Tax=Plasticicumulans acidivorans TaxID=886464 RepID=A0A317N179_9GAMM|nr:OsmC family protein [Plasticicumulans acidivorans]PWV65900.1 putative OsmC-like protein [Plasticicumulans acidivorans]
MKTVSVQAKLGPAFTIEVQTEHHTVYIDQPKNSGGAGMGPSPLEYMFSALAGCIGTIGRIVANQQKLPVRGMDIRVEGEMDPAVLLGKSTEGRAGFVNLTVTVDIDADMTREQKEAYLHEVDRRCPVSDNYANGVPIKFIVAD